jgi:hypothetical protein
MKRVGSLCCFVEQKFLSRIVAQKYAILEERMRMDK